MAVQLPNGSLVAIASGYGSPITATGISNGDPGVVTAAAHGLSDGDIIEVTSGWSRLTDKIVRVDNSATGTFELEGINTTSTSVYASGGGAGTVREITGWTQLAQILTSASQGGEQQFLTYQFLEADAEKRIPTFKNAAGITFSIAYDPDLSGYQLVQTANDDRQQRAVRITLADGSLLYYNAYISLGTIPSLDVNQLMAVEVTLSLLNEPVRYAS